MQAKKKMQAPCNAMQNYVQEQRLGLWASACHTTLLATCESLRTVGDRREKGQKKRTHWRKGPSALGSSSPIWLFNLFFFLALWGCQDRRGLLFYYKLAEGKGRWRKTTRTRWFSIRFDLMTSLAAAEWKGMDRKKSCCHKTRCCARWDELRLDWPGKELLVVPAVNSIVLVVLSFSMSSTSSQTHIL